jgi:signal peptidase I
MPVVYRREPEPTGSCRLLRAALWAAVGPAVLAAWLQPYRLVLVRGESMLPTLADLQVVLAKPPARPAKVGEIVVFPVAGEACVKRVTAGPGSVYRHEATGTAMLVGNGQVFVEGDNAARSFDSRHYGPIAMDRIQYVVVPMPGLPLAR